jgi:leucyl-tRNA synthetase
LLHQTIDGVSSDYEGLRFNTAIAKLIELNNHLTKVAGAGGAPGSSATSGAAAPNGDRGVAGEPGSARAVGGLTRDVAEPLVLMMAPLTPHLAEELWQQLGHDSSLAYHPFPIADPALLVADSVEYPVQINGKVRSRITVAASAAPAEVEAAALADSKVVASLDGSAVKKVIVIPGRMVNIVA